MVKTIEWVDGTVLLLDQSKLPFEVIFVRCSDYRTVAEGIRKLWIRGAPAIGIAAAMGIALGVQDIRTKSSDEFIKRVQPVFHEMLSTRPTAVNIRWAVERMQRLLHRNRDESTDRLKELVINEAQSILAEDVLVNKAIGKWGAESLNLQ